MFDELVAAADAGHVGAACRLAWDLQRCNTLASRGNVPDFYVEGAARTPEGSAEEQELMVEVAAAQERLERDKTVCEGLSDDQLDQGAKRMLQAAQLGHAASQALFAMWPPFGSRLTVDEAEAALFHRDHALDLLRDAAASGEPAGLLGLFDACRSGEIRTLHGTVEVGRDPVCAMATALALRRFADRATASEAEEVIGESAEALDVAQQQLAREQASMYAKRFQQYSHYDFASGIFKPQLLNPCGKL